MPSLKRVATGCLLAFVGVMAAHALLFAAAFACGAVFGCAKLHIGHPQPPAGPTEYGARGGSHAVEVLLVAYIFTFGVLPIAVTAIGAAAPTILRRLIPEK